MNNKHGEIKDAPAKWQAHILIAGMVALIIFILIAMDVANNGTTLKIDAWLNAEMLTLQNPIFNGTIVLITQALSPMVLIALAIGVATALLYKKEKDKALFIAFTIGGGAFVGYAMKYLFHRLRPENGLIEATNYSFPSGHAMTATIFFMLTLYIFGKEIKNRVRKFVFIAANVSLLLLAGLSRLYLNVHWLSDVVAGFMLGLAWLFFAIYFKRRTHLNH